MANSLKAALIAAGLGLARALEPERQAKPPATRYEEIQKTEFQQMMQRLLAQEYQFTQPKWVGKPRLTVAQMMAKYHGGAKDLTPKVNEKEVARLGKEIPQMPIANVIYDDNLNPTFIKRDGTRQTLEDLT